MQRNLHLLSSDVLSLFAGFSIQERLGLPLPVVEQTHDRERYFLRLADDESLPYGNGIACQIIPIFQLAYRDPMFF